MQYGAVQTYFNDGGVEECTYSMEACGRVLLMGSGRVWRQHGGVRTCITNGGVEECAYRMEVCECVLLTGE